METPGGETSAASGRRKLDERPEWGADAEGDDGTRRARVRPLRGNVTIATGFTPLESREPETEATEAVASSRRAEQHAPHGESHGATAAAPGSRKLAKSPERGADAEGDDRARSGEPPESRGPKKGAKRGADAEGGGPSEIFSERDKINPRHRTSLTTAKANPSEVATARARLAVDSRWQ